MQDSLRGPVFVLLSALCFSLSGTLQALAPEGATPFVVAAVRTLVGSSFLFAWCLWKRRLPGRWGDVPWRWVFACAAWLLTATLSFFFGTAEIGVAAGTVIANGMTPVWAAVFALLLYRKRPHWEWYVATALAVLGVFHINGIGEIPRDKVIYLHLLILNGFAFAGYMTTTPKLVRHLQPDVATMLVMAVVAVMLLPAYFLFPSGWIVSSLNGAFVAVSLGIVTAGLAYTFLASGLRFTSPVVASTLSLAEPMSAAALGIFLLGEPATVRSYGGILLIFFALSLLTYADHRRAVKAAQAAA